MKKYFASLCLALLAMVVADPVSGGTKPRRPPPSSKKSSALTPVQAILGGILAGIAFEVTRNVADRLIADAYRQNKPVVYNDPSGVRVQARPVRNYQRPLPVDVRVTDTVPAERIHPEVARTLPEKGTETGDVPAAAVPEKDAAMKADQPAGSNAPIQPEVEIRQAVDRNPAPKTGEGMSDGLQSKYDPEWASSRESILKANRELDPESYSKLPPETGMEPVVVRTEINPAQAATKPAAADPAPVKSKPSEKKLASSAVRQQNCSEIEITTFKDGKVVGMEMREVCE